MSGQRQRNSEAPYQAGGCAVVALIGAEVVAAHVIALQAPGKILEHEFVVGAAADVDDDWIVNVAERLEMLNASHGVDKGTPFSEVGGKARAEDGVILPDAGAIVT